MMLNPVEERAAQITDLRTTAPPGRYFFVGNSFDGPMPEPGESRLEFTPGRNSRVRKAFAIPRQTAAPNPLPLPDPTA